MRQYRQQQQENEVLPSYVPGDIIKERVEPKPELGPLWEMLNKRYRTPKENPHQVALREERLDILEEKALEKTTLKEAYDFMLAELIKYDGHERNIIRTETEIAEIKVKDAKAAIIQVVLNGYKKQHSDFMITGALNRQVAMRKVKFYHYIGLDNFRQRLIAGEYMTKEMKDVPKQIGTARNPKTVMAKEAVYNLTEKGIALFTKLETKSNPRETSAEVESLLVDLGFSIV